MAQFFAFIKTLWEIIKVVKQIKAYFDEIYIKKLEEEQKKKADALRQATDAIEDETSKPVEQTSDEDLMNAHRNRNKSTRQ
ncbi:MAG: hypothetical protein HRU18_01115 [Pseudoalteromonas sp.]|uniref:hypothetical protein n=1 Tax=Pseudoalteromonas sp. TaxID=53249 RepID=UPI001DA76359|nr:hypothetical protein [Pseudoalteromonas sp.]NRA76779.1 hypothetical protein [Pseudoalteromonas sp.]